MKVLSFLLKNYRWLLLIACALVGAFSPFDDFSDIFPFLKGASAVGFMWSFISITNFYFKKD